MLKTLEEIFETGTIEVDPSGKRIPLHSNTSQGQCAFLQKIFDVIRPSKSLEVGFAYGISALCILEKHRELGSSKKAHIAIEPDDYWGNVSMHNIEKEGLEKYLQVLRDYSDKILPQLYRDNYRIQFAYVDTTKRFDIVFQDFYFIDKLLDVGGVIILDDCGEGIPGVQRVVRFINALPHYKVLEGYKKINTRLRKKIARSSLSFIIKALPFKKTFYQTFNFRTDKELGLDYRCIAFQKIGEDNRNWNWDKSF